MLLLSTCIFQPPVWVLLFRSIFCVNIWSLHHISATKVTDLHLLYIISLLQRWQAFICSTPYLCYKGDRPSSALHHISATKVTGLHLLYREHILTFAFHTFLDRCRVNSHFVIQSFLWHVTSSDTWHFYISPLVQETPCISTPFCCCCIILLCLPWIVTLILNKCVIVPLSEHCLLNPKEEIFSDRQACKGPFNCYVTACSKCGSVMITHRQKLPPSWIVFSRGTNTTVNDGRVMTFTYGSCHAALN